MIQIVARCLSGLAAGLNEYALADKKPFQTAAGPGTGDFVIHRALGAVGV